MRMSYYKGGRGSYRGGGSSYRGSRGGSGDSWRGSRGSFGGSSSRGGASRYSSYPSPTYDSRSRSSYPGGVATDRYSRGAREESYHRYSQEVGGYAARDYGRAISPEPPRKRPRPETSPPYMAPRRSHERSFASDYSGGRSYYDKGGAGASSSGGGGYLGEKPYTREVRERGSEFAFRKPASYPSLRGSGGGFRGRSVGRGLRSRPFRSASSFLRKRDSFAIRKRAAAGITSRSEYIRRLKQLRLRRRLRRAHAQSDDKGSDDEEADLKAEDDQDEDGSGGEEEEEDDSSEEAVEENENNDNEAETAADGDPSDERSEKKGGDDEKKQESKVVQKKVVKKKIKKKSEDASEPGESKTDGEGKKDTNSPEKNEDEDDSDKQPLTDFLGQPFIKLKCPHCLHICVTFKEYSKHLETRKHQKSMQELFTKLRKTLATMRMEQRKKQRALDEECKAKNMRLKTFFCSICKLNYRTLKSHHQASSSHRKMSEFLLPFCTVCRMWFKSAWSYESHLCELPHIKKKARLDKLSRPPTARDDSLLADKEDDMLDTSSFMVLDSVGSGDDSDVDKSDDPDNKEVEKNEELPEKDAGKKKKSEIKLGVEHCKMVQVYYCDLCKIYLPRLDDKERALAIHCRSRSHLQRYVRLNKTRKTDENLRRKAVRLHKEKQKLKEKEKKEETTKEESNKGDEEGKEKGTGEEEKHEEESKEGGGGKKGEEEEEKAWSEVDKDLSDLLHDNEDEEETPKERYDRFKKSDKTITEAENKPNGTLPVADD